MERYIKQINNIWESQKITAEFSSSGHVWNEGVTTQERKEMEVSTLLLGNDKSNIIANKLLSYS